MDKTQAISALKEADPRKRFGLLVGLFIAHPQHSLSVARFMNASGYNRDNLKTLEYDFKKLYNISPSDLNRTVEEKASEKGKVVDLNPQNDFEKLSYADLKKLANEKATEFGIKLKNQKKDTLIEFLSEFEEPTKEEAQSTKEEEEPIKEEDTDDGKKKE